MSDYDEDGNPIEGNEPAEPKRNWRRDLEDKAREADTAKAEADAAKRELAFVKAGIDPENPTPQQKLFMKAYDGQPTVEAIKASAVEYGVLEPAAPTVPAEELAALDRVSNASAGATTGNEEHDLLAELDKASTPDEVFAVFQKAGIGIDTAKPGRWLRGDGNTPVATPIT